MENLQHFSRPSSWIGEPTSKRRGMEREGEEGREESREEKRTERGPPPIMDPIRPWQMDRQIDNPVID